jgi:hypothetical protein
MAKRRIETKSGAQPIGAYLQGARGRFHLRVGTRTTRYAKGFVCHICVRDDDLLFVGA